MRTLKFLGYHAYAKSITAKNLKKEHAIQDCHGPDDMR